MVCRFAPAPRVADGRARLAVLLALLAAWYLALGARSEAGPPWPMVPAGVFGATGQGDDEGDPASGFDIGLVGDWGYTPRQRQRLPRLIEAMNGAGLAFSIHDGDVKDGPPPCTEETYLATRDLFDRFRHPLIYTPGDNEWTDCWRSGGDPLDRLAALRRLFFRDGASRGRPRMALTRQSDRFPENARWKWGGVTFATVHLAGSNNGLPGSDRPGNRQEWAERLDADLAWIRQAFGQARTGHSPGLALFIHGDPRFERPPGQRYGYDEFLRALEREVAAFGRPVLLVHGDTHRYRLDRPSLGYGDPGRKLANFTRAETFGPKDLAYVRVRVDPESAQVFHVRPVMLGPPCRKSAQTCR